MAIHDIDMLVWLTSCAAPKSVFVMTHIRDETLQKIGEPDAGVVALTFQDGLMATIDVFRECVYGYDIRTEVRLPQGSRWYVPCVRHAYRFITFFYLRVHVFWIKVLVLVFLKKNWINPLLWFKKKYLVNCYGSSFFLQINFVQQQEEYTCTIKTYTL